MIVLGFDWPMHSDTRLASIDTRESEHIIRLGTYPVSFTSQLTISLGENLHQIAEGRPIGPVENLFPR